MEPFSEESHSWTRPEPQQDSPIEYLELGHEELLCPGMVDLHIHAPQYAFTGTATDRPLMGPKGWLETYTFPAEASLRDNPERCQAVYRGVVERTLRCGTTTAVYFATLHLDPCQTLVNIVKDVGQRALIGKVCMDRNSPEFYIQSLEQNLEETEVLIQYIHKTMGRRSERAVIKSGQSSPTELLPLVLPLVTPRFIPTCTPALMTGLGKLAAKYDCHITSHISESVDEVDFSRHLDATQDFPAGGGKRTDAQIFDSHQLLTDQCIMAHGVYLSSHNENDNCLDDHGDWELMKKRGAAVAHCPLSNFVFSGRSLRCRRLMEQGVKVGLGTDVAGGYDPSMFHSSRMAVVASISCDHEEKVQQPEYQQQEQKQDIAAGEDSSAITKRRKVTTSMPTTQNAMDYRHAFYLATLGGAEALGLQDRIGTLAVGMEFDALVLSAAKERNGPVQIFDSDSLADIFQKLCVLGDDRNVKHVFVQGRHVKTP
ncbi:hypothetical protein ACA910_003828 [Epithemia clementina (nom. ined.)]